MEESFWHDKWEKSEIGFHQDDHNPSLIKYWPSLDLPRGSKVFVPLCGKSKDMGWLKERGHKVLGNEVSAVAANAFFRENNLSADKKGEGPLVVHTTEHFNILQGNFFSLAPAHTKNVRGVYDRASLIALPPQERWRYAAHMRRLLPGGCSILLITLEYEEQSPPPFNVPEKEVRDLYGPWCEVELLGRQESRAKELEAREGIYRLRVTS